MLRTAGRLQAANTPGVTMIPLGNGEAAPADVVILTQLMSSFGLHTKQVAWVMNVSCSAIIVDCDSLGQAVFALLKHACSVCKSNALELHMPLKP